MDRNGGVRKLRLHYGSVWTGYAFAAGLPLVAAMARHRLASETSQFPYILFYPLIGAVAFIFGLAPAAASILFSAFSVAIFLPGIHPESLNLMALALFGSGVAALGAGTRLMRESAAESARALVRFRSVTENINDWIFFVNPDGRVQYANRAACAGLMRPLHDIVGRPVASFIQPERRAEVPDLISAALAGRPAIREWVFELAQGEAVPVELECTAISNEGETVVHIAGRDLRERKEAERKLREARQWEALGALAGGLAHEFNNLLTAMIGNASLAEQMLPPDHEIAQLIENVIRAGARAAKLIDMMLAAAGYRRNFVQQLRLDALLHSALARVAVPEKVTISTEVAEGVYVGESSSLERLLVCLVENAVEAYGPTGGAVRVALRLAAAEPREPATFEEGDCGDSVCLCVVVEDQGCGMDAETIERAFDPFFTTKFMGRGLGLAAVRGIVRAYAGKLWMKSGPGEGTRVEVWLPQTQQKAS